MPQQVPIILRHGPLTVYLKPLERCPDLAAFVRALPEGSPVMWLDSARHHEVTGRWSLVGCEPWLTFTARGDRMELTTSASTRVWREHPLTALRHLLQTYHAPAISQPQSRAIGLLGFLSYDLNR